MEITDEDFAAIQRQVYKKQAGQHADDIIQEAALAWIEADFPEDRIWSRGGLRAKIVKNSIADFWRRHGQEKQKPNNSPKNWPHGGGDDVGIWHNGKTPITPGADNVVLDANEPEFRKPPCERVLEKRWPDPNDHSWRADLPAIPANVAADVTGKTTGHDFGGGLDASIDLERCAAALTDHQRILLEMLMAGKATRDIAAHMGQPPSTIMSQIALMRKILIEQGMGEYL